MEISTLKFVVRSGGTLQEFLVNSDTALVGSGAHCEIRLAAEDAPVEQLLIQVRAGGVFGEARSLDPPTLLNGAPFTQGRLLPDSLLRIGSAELSVSLIQTDRGQQIKKGKQQSTNPVVLALSAVGFPLGLYTIFMAGPAKTALPEPVEPPALWAQVEQASCPQADPEAAAALGDKELLRAEAARERAPFSPGDGVAAVQSFARAAACLKAAGQAEAADASQGAAEDLRQKMESEFHVHQVRLDRALATRQYESARTEVRLLLSFVSGRGGEYAEWLSTLDRQIELRYSGKKRK